MPTLDVARIASATSLVPNESEPHILSGLPVDSLGDAYATEAEFTAG